MRGKKKKEEGKIKRDDFIFKCDGFFLIQMRIVVLNFGFILK